MNRIIGHRIAATHTKTSDLFLYRVGLVCTVPTVFGLNLYFTNKWVCYIYIYISNTANDKHSSFILKDGNCSCDYVYYTFLLSDLDRKYICNYKCMYIL